MMNVLKHNIYNNFGGKRNQDKPKLMLEWLIHTSLGLKRENQTVLEHPMLLLEAELSWIT